MASSRFKITFDLVNKELDVTDDNVYSVPMTGILRITSPIGVIYANAGYTTSNFDSPDISNNGTKTVLLPLDVDGAVVRGTYQIEYKTSDGTRTYTLVKSYSLSYQSPAMDLSVQSNIRTSTLSSTDKTIYKYGDINPLSVTRAHKLTPPVTSGQLAITGTGVTLSAGPNIWTKTWIASLTSTFSYELDTWYGSPWVIIQDRISGEEPHDVETDELIEEYFACAAALYARFADARISRPSEAERLRGFILQLSGQYMLYTWAKSTGNDFSQYAVAIYQTLQIATECALLPSTDRSLEVIPWASIPGAGSSSSTIWYSGDGAPESSQGANGDYYLNETTADIYKKAGGSWGLIINIKGATGPAGTGLTGNKYYTYSAGTSIAAATQTLAAKDINPTLIPVAGDTMEITANITVSQPSNFPTSKTRMVISLRLKSTDFCTKRIEVGGTIELNIKIKRVDATHLIVSSEYETTEILLSSVTDSGVIPTGVYVQKNPNGAIADVVVNQITYNVQKVL